MIWCDILFGLLTHVLLCINEFFVL